MPPDWRIHRLYRLRRRTPALEGAVVLTATSGVFTCLATLGFPVGAFASLLVEIGVQQTERLS